MPNVTPRTNEPARLEGVKQLHDSLKHLTTLSTGSIVLTVAFLEKLFSNPEWKGIIIISILAFVGSLFCSVTGMLLQSIDTMNIENVGKSHDIESIGKFMAISYYLFFAGVLALAVFFLKNFL